MKILAIEVETTPAPRERMQAYLRSEALRVWDLYQQGIIREVYFQHEEHLTVLISETEDLREAKLVIQSLPLVEVGLIDFTLIPLIPYEGFARLFAP